MPQWEWSNPAQGSASGLAAGASALLLSEAKFAESRRATIGFVSSISEAVWSGESGEAWRSTTRISANSSLAIEQTLGDIAAAISTYVDDFGRIKAQTRDAQEVLVQAQNVVWSLPEESFLNIPGRVEEAWERVRAVEASTEAAYNIMVLARQRQDAEDALISALASAVPASWPLIRAQFERVGIAGVHDLESEEIADAMKGLAEEYLSSGSSEEQREALAELMAAYGSDEQVMSSFFQKLGGAQAVSLIDRLGQDFSLESRGNPEMPPQSLPSILLAQALRNGLSLGSQSWSADAAADFASTILQENVASVDGGPAWTNVNGAIAFLFSDSAEAPMGSQLSLAVANEIDVMERENGFFLSDSESPLQAGVLQMMIAEDLRSEGFNDLSADEALSTSMLDGADRVFETLGLYPEQAFDFLADAGQGDARIGYWFGERDWASPTGFDGVAALWFGAAQVEGGPNVNFDYDGTEGGVGQQEASMTAQIIRELAANPVFGVEKLTDEAAIDLAGALSLHLDGFAAAEAEGAVVPRVPGQQFMTWETSGGEYRSGPNIDLNQLGEVLGQVAGNPSGAVVLRSAALQLSEGYFDALSPNSSMEDIQSAMVRSNVVSGLIDGGGAGALIGAAERSDLELQTEISSAGDAASLVLGLLPIPGGSLVEAGASAITDAIVGEALDRVFSDHSTAAALVRDADLLRGEALIHAEFANAVALHDILGTDRVGGYPRFSGAAEEEQSWLAGFYQSGGVAEEFRTDGWIVRYEQAYAAAQGDANEGIY
ncbi:hypothetical protein [Salinibacterium sp. NK8237]|uniref:hypothetical protein n=1 Tax=Salinibacterium sp. NK8237 TaxID=2792038 RepID=UPI0018CE372C|nr:hypothetical protein [Salinibacterium sp. NK8237]MBH0129790.1 hypothetical protein [Salinibacterium sp. NK8237]